ncbi:hypothetical protein HDV05_008135 [Chytridiales sp. JEL 0842]|nr:hypothetical protein HDV05_008135 [Chytridiales sp. JEL 0842]
MIQKCRLTRDQYHDPYISRWIGDLQLTTIPQAISQLPNLEFLTIHNNTALSSIPPFLSTMRTLKLLDLWNNNIREFPSFIGDMISLESLGMSQNPLRAPIPDLSRLVNLKELYLYDSQMIGSIPASIGGLRSLETLQLSRNFLEIPTTLVNLPNATYIDLSSNQLTGNIPTGFGSVGVVNVEDNCLKGSIGGSQIKSQRDNCSVNPVIGNNNRTDTEIETGSNNVVPLAVKLAAGILALIAVVAFLVVRRRRQKREMDKGSVNMQRGVAEVQEVDGSTLLKLDHATLRHDMPTLSLRTRLSIVQKLQELCAEWNMPFESEIQQQQDEAPRGTSGGGYRLSAIGVAQPGDKLFAHNVVDLEKVPELEEGGDGDLPPAPLFHDGLYAADHGKTDSVIFAIAKRRVFGHAAFEGRWMASKQKNVAVFIKMAFTVARLNEAACHEFLNNPTNQPSRIRFLPQLDDVERNKRLNAIQACLEIAMSLLHDHANSGRFKLEVTTPPHGFRRFTPAPLSTSSKAMFVILDSRGMTEVFRHWQKNAEDHPDRYVHKRIPRERERDVWAELFRFNMHPDDQADDLADDPADDLTGVQRTFRYPMIPKEPNDVELNAKWFTGTMRTDGYSAHWIIQRPKSHQFDGKVVDPGRRDLGTAISDRHLLKEGWERPLGDLPPEDKGEEEKGEKGKSKKAKGGGKKKKTKNGKPSRKDLHSSLLAKFNQLVGAGGGGGGGGGDGGGGGSEDRTRFRCTNQSQCLMQNGTLRLGVFGRASSGTLC